MAKLLDSSPMPSWHKLDLVYNKEVFLYYGGKRGDVVYSQAIWQEADFCHFLFAGKNLIKGKEFEFDGKMNQRDFDMIVNKIDSLNFKEMTPDERFFSLRLQFQFKRHQVALKTKKTALAVFLSRAIQDNDKAAWTLEALVNAKFPERSRLHHTITSCL